MAVDIQNSAFYINRGCSAVRRLLKKSCLIVKLSIEFYIHLSEAIVKKVESQWIP